MNIQDIRSHITDVVHTRLSDSKDRRTAALGEFMGVTIPTIDEKAAESVSSMIPEIPSTIYDKWIGMFVDRLQETVPLDQLTELCTGTDENKATISLIYVMFMESQRMEKQVAKDLATLGMEQAQQDDVSNTLAEYLRVKLADMKGDTRAQ